MGDRRQAVTVTLDREVKQQAQRAAMSASQSFSRYCEVALRYQLSQQKKGGKK